MKEKINKQILFIKLILTLFLTITFISCEKEEQSLSEDEIYNTIQRLANQYNLDIQFKEGTNEKKININSLSELEDFFEKRRNDKQKTITKKLSLKNNNKNTFVYRSNTSIKYKKKLRFKTGGIEDDQNIDNLSEWFYDLTWFNTSIKYDKDSNGKIINVQINSSYSGIGVYKYKQTNSAVRVEGSKIFFETQGTETAEYNIFGVPVIETRPINTNGFIDTSTGQGEINTGGNGYWGN